MTETNPQVAADPAATSNAAPAAADQSTEASQASNSPDTNSQAETASAASVADKPDAAASDQKAASAAVQVETETEKLPVPEVTAARSVSGALTQVYVQFTARKDSPELSHLPQQFWDELETAMSHLRDDSFGIRRAILNVLKLAGDPAKYEDACCRSLEYLKTVAAEIDAKASEFAELAMKIVSERHGTATPSSASVSSEQPQAMMQFFAFNHLAPPMKSVSQAFHDLAVQVVENIGQGPERTVVLRKLLEAKDAAVRAVIYPGA